MASGARPWADVCGRLTTQRGAHVASRSHRRIQAIWRCDQVPVVGVRPRRFPDFETKPDLPSREEAATSLPMSERDETSDQPRMKKKGSKV